MYRNIRRFTALQCEKCKGAAVGGKCLDCEAQSQHVSKHSKIDANNILETCDNIDILKQKEKILAKFLYKHHEVLATLRDTIAKVSVDNGCIKEALAMLELSLDYTKARYGDNSIEFGHELLKFSDVLFISVQANGDSRQRTKLCDILQQALLIFQLNYGSESKLCKEIIEKLGLLK